MITSPVKKSGIRYPKLQICAPKGIWNLNVYQKIGVEIKNTGIASVTLSCWAVSKGWGGVGGYGIDGSLGNTTITLNLDESSIQYINIQTRYKEINVVDYSGVKTGNNYNIDIESHIVKDYLYL